TRGRFSMPNSNTILAPFTGIVQANPTSESCFPSVPGGSVRAILTLPAGGMWDGRPFRLWAAMRITGGTTTNHTPLLRWNSGANTNLTTLTGDTALIATVASAVNTVTRCWYCQADLVWDSTSQRLVGAYEL